MFGKLFSVFTKDFAIDLGTANTLIYIEGEGVILREPSVVAIQKATNKILAVGKEAKKMLGKTPGKITAIRPMKDGVIADFEMVEKMIRHFISKVSKKKSLFKPRIAIGVPSSITPVERRAVQESCEQAGAREVFIIEEPLAAAIGANMPIDDPAGNMIIDIGGGTTEIAIISLGDMVIESSIRIGGDGVDRSIVNFMKRNYNLIIGERTAEDIKINFLDVWNVKSRESYDIRGRDSITGLPRVQKVSKTETKGFVDEAIEIIISEIKIVLDKTPPELAADIMERGIVLSGGGALMKGFKHLLSHEIGTPVITAEDPLSCVVKGASIYLKNYKSKNKLNEFNL